MRQMSRHLPISDVSEANAAPPQSSNAATYEQGRMWARLMRLAQDGDRAAYRSLLTNITPYLRTLCARQHRDPRDVEDSVQDILLTIHTIRHTYDPARPFKPWLVAIGRRRIIDRLRTNRRFRLRETELLAEHETFRTDETNIHEAQSESRVLHEAVETLPTGQREAIRLLKIEGKSLNEAAAESGMTVSALKVSTHRAIKALRKILEGGGQDP
jgi:RNA polymerase sigma-70 factor (ECF subfamily)